MEYYKILKPTIFVAAILLCGGVFSQERSLLEKIRQADDIEIHFLKKKQPCIYRTTRKIDLHHLKTLVTGATNNPELRCDTTGIIIYFKGNKKLAEAYFSSKGTGGRFSAVTFRDRGGTVTSLLNYGTGMLLNEEFYRLTSSK